MTVSKEAFSSAAFGLLEEVVQRNQQDIDLAARILAATMSGGGVIHAFGTGHSQAAALELAGRAGGLIPTNRIALADLVLHHGWPPDTLRDPLLERDAGVAAQLLERSDVRPGDAFVIISNSGVNASVVEMGLRVAKLAVPIVAVTSRTHSSAVSPQHPSGQRLLDLADVVLDNGAPLGDAILDAGNGVTVCGVSSITTTFLLQMVVAETVAGLLRSGHDAPVYRSANVPGGHERNLVIEQQYAGRLRRLGG